MSDEHTLRQRLVAEIGEQGQARIASTTAHASSEIEARYLAFAGFREVHDRTEKQGEIASPLLHALVERALVGSDRDVVDLAVGAARALAQIKKAAGVE